MIRDVITSHPRALTFVEPSYGSVLNLIFHFPRVLTLEESTHRRMFTYLSVLNSAETINRSVNRSGANLWEHIYSGISFLRIVLIIVEPTTLVFPYQSVYSLAEPTYHSVLTVVSPYSFHSRLPEHVKHIAEPTLWEHS